MTTTPDRDPVPDNLGYICSAAARRMPDAPALIDIRRDGRERQLSYGELERRCDRVAAYLTALGLEPGARVFVLIGNRLEFVEVIFGAMRAGLAPIPGNYRAGADTLEHVLRDSGAAAAIVDPEANPHVRALVEAASSVPIRVALGDAPAGWLAHDTLLEGDAPAPAAAVTPDTPSLIPYTSGSTGKPKGVVLTHGGQRWWLETALRRFGPAFHASQTILVAVPLFHKNAMAGAIKPFLAVGGCVVILEAFDARTYLEAIARHRCTQTTGVPALYSLLLAEHSRSASLDLSSWRLLRIGSAPCDVSLLEQLADTFGVTVSQGYGLTEGGPVMMGPASDGRPTPLGSCGVAWSEGEVRLVDADGRDHPSVGELWVRNPGVTPGYLGQPTLNAERLKDGWLRTGDLFFRDDGGFFFFRGRVDDMFVCGGENVYPMEVEAVLRRHPAVIDVCVVPLPHAVKGEAPAALVACRTEDRPAAEDLRAFYLEHGPAYSHPRRIVIVDALPVSGAGKVDRRAVRERLAAAGAEPL